MRLQTSLHGAINEFRDQARALACSGDNAALHDLYGYLIQEADTALPQDAIWYMSELRRALSETLESNGISQPKFSIGDDTEFARN
jgi:hypothetical protein